MMNTCDNPDLSNYFDKNFAEYKKGFQSKGENYSYPPIWQVFNLLRPVRVSNTFNCVLWFENLGILKSSKSPQSSYMRFSHAYTSKQILQHRIDLILGEIWLGLETLHKLTDIWDVVPTYCQIYACSRRAVQIVWIVQLEGLDKNLSAIEIWVGELKTTG